MASFGKCAQQHLVLLCFTFLMRSMRVCIQNLLSASKGDEHSFCVHNETVKTLNNKCLHIMGF